MLVLDRVLTRSLTHKTSFQFTLKHVLLAFFRDVINRCQPSFYKPFRSGHLLLFVNEKMLAYQICLTYKIMIV